MPKRDLHEVGNETINAQMPASHVSNSAYDYLCRMANGMNYEALSPQSTYVTGDMPSHIPSGADSIIHGIAKIKNEAHQISKAKDEETSELIKANLYPMVTSYLDNMDVHMKLFTQQYLAEHPDGKGLRQAVAQELYDGLTISFSGADWVDNAKNLIMGGLKNLNPEVSKYAKQSIYKISQNAISQATMKEFVAGQQYRENLRNAQLHNLKIAASNVSTISDFQDIATKFMGLVDGLRIEAGDDENAMQSANLFTEQHSLDLMARALHSYANNNPGAFLEAEKEGLFKKIVPPMIVEAEKRNIEDKIKKENLVQSKQAFKQMLQMQYQQDKQTYKDLLRKVRIDPDLVSDDEIFNSLKTKTDINKIISEKNKMQKRDIQYYEALSKSANDISKGNGIAVNSEQDQLDIVHTYADNTTSPNNSENPMAIVEVANDLQNIAEDRRLIDKYNVEIDKYAMQLVQSAQSPNDNNQNIDMNRMGQIMGAYKQAYDTGQSILGCSSRKNDIARNKFIETCILLMDVRGIEPIDIQDKNFDLSNPQHYAQLEQYQNDVASVLYQLKDYQLTHMGSSESEKKPSSVSATLNRLKEKNPFFQSFYEQERRELEDAMKASGWLWGKNNVDTIPQWDKDELMTAFDKTISEAWIFQKMGCSDNEALKMAKAKFYKKYIPTVIYGMPEKDEKHFMLLPPEIQIPNSQNNGSPAQEQLILRTATFLRAIEKAINANEIPYLDSFLEKGAKIKYINPPELQYDNKDGGYPKVIKYQRPQFKLVDGNNQDKIMDVEFRYDEKQDAYTIQFVLSEEMDAENGSVIRSMPLRNKKGVIQYIKFNSQDIIKATEKLYYREKKKKE